MKERIPSMIAYLIIILFFIGAVIIILYQYFSLEQENRDFEMQSLEINRGIF